MSTLQNFITHFFTHVNWNFASMCYVGYRMYRDKCGSMEIMHGNIMCVIKSVATKNNACTYIDIDIKIY